MGLVLSGIWQANRVFAPEMYGRKQMPAVAEAFSRGESFAVFDLNINIRELRNAHLALMSQTPDVVVLGASHWQEAHDDLIPHKRMYNAHVHRDYYEDMLGVTEMLVRHEKLPRQMIIAIRDKLLTPVSQRTDHLWLPIAPYYRAMARRLQLDEHGWLDTAPVPRWREQLSLAMLHTNVQRWYEAPVKPHATLAVDSETLDILMPDGSIVWSAQHKQVFTAARTRKLSHDFAVESAKSPPVIDPKGVVALEALFTFLRNQGVELYFAHPPFNPQFYDQVKGTPYMDGLRKIEDLTKHWAGKFGARVIGSFDPQALGCKARMYIDAEHSSAECLGKLFDQFNELDRAGEGLVPVAPRAPEGPAVASVRPHVAAVIEHRVAGVVQQQRPALRGSVIEARASEEEPRPQAEPTDAAPRSERQPAPLIVHRPPPAGRVAHFSAAVRPARKARYRALQKPKSRPVVMHRAAARPATVRSMVWPGDRRPAPAARMTRAVR